MKSIKTNLIHGLTVAALTYEPVIAATGGAFVGLVDESDAEAVARITDCLQGTIESFPLENLIGAEPAKMTPGCRPMIFISPEAVATLTSDELLFILYHEQGHIECDHQKEMMVQGVDMNNKSQEMQDRHEIEADTFGFRNCNLTGEQCVKALEKMLLLSAKTSQKMNNVDDPEDIENFLEHVMNSDHFQKRVTNLLSLTR